MVHVRLLVGLGVLACLSAGGAQPSGNVALTPAAGETIPGGAFPNGTIDVTSGTVTMTASADEVRLGDYLADPALTNISHLTFWVDANVNCITNADGAVVQWADVRETFEGGVPTADHAFAFKRGLVYQPDEGSTDIGGEAPIFKTDARFPGRKFLDFGDYGSGRWMYLADPDAKILRQKTRTYYCVIGFDTKDNCGHILSDIASLAAKGSGTVFFHKGTGGSAAGTISAGSADSCMYLGETRKDGVRIDPRTTSYTWDDFQVLGQVGPYTTSKGEPYFSTLFNDRNIEFPGSASGYRQGGGVLGELLTWNRVLSESERRQVEAYLFAKWFARPTGGAATIASGARLVVAAGETPAALDSAEGDGTLVKQGAGTLTLERSRTPGAKLRIEEGVVVLADSLQGAAIEPVAGTRLTVTNGTLSAGAAAEAGTAELVGHGSEALSVDPADLTAKTVRLRAMELTLTPKNTAARGDPPSLVERYPNLLQNASFETPARADGGYGEALLGTATYFWTSPVVANAISQVNIATYNSPWYTYATNTIPDGRQFVSVQSKDGVSGTLSQTFDAPVRGLYRLTFHMTRRTSRSERPGELIASMAIDGTEFFRAPVTDDYRGAIDAFKQYTAVLPPLAKGSHVLAITVVADNVTTDRALLLDDIRLFPFAEGEYIHVPNSGFDSVGVCVGCDPANGWFRGAPAGTGWTGKGSWGVTHGRSTWFVDYYSTDLLVDYAKIYLQMAASVSTTVNVPRDGRVRVSFLYSNRARRGWQTEEGNRVGEPRPTGHALVACLDDQVVARVTPLVGDAIWTGCGVFDVTAGTHTLTLSNELNGVTADVASIVDEVRMVYVDDSEPEIVPASAFTNPAACWTLSDCTPVLNAKTGRQELVMDPGGHGDLLIDVPSNGYYQVVASFAGRAFELESSDGVYNSFQYYPAAAGVLIGGRSVIRARLQDDTPRAYRAAVYLPSGRQTLVAECLAAGSAASAKVRLSDLRILPMALPALADPKVAKETKLVLDASSKLNLEFDGTLVVGGLTVGDTVYTGEVDATTLPGVITGAGAFKVCRKGTIVFVR